MTKKKQTKKTLTPRKGGSVTVEPETKQLKSKEEDKANAG